MRLRAKRRRPEEELEDHLPAFREDGTIICDKTPCDVLVTDKPRKLVIPTGTRTPTTESQAGTAPT